MRALNAETAPSGLTERLALGGVREHEIDRALDWLLERQPSIEKAPVQQHLSKGTLTLYDVSSFCREGDCCELAQHGHSRDHAANPPQRLYDLLCDTAGVPILVEAFDGDTADPSTLPAPSRPPSSSFVSA